MNQPTKDLFDNSTMTFGEHLEILRVHLIKAIIGLVIATILCLLQGAKIVEFVRRPIDRALVQYSEIQVTDDAEDVKRMQDKLWSDWGFDVLYELVFGTAPKRVAGESADGATAGLEKQKRRYSDTVLVHLDVDELARALHQALPERFPQLADSGGNDGGNSSPDTEEVDAAAVPPPNRTVPLRLHAPEFAQFQATVEQSRRPVTLNVQEAFLTYLKVSLIAGVLLASPWIFYQIWQFVAAGLYPHERKFVYIYGALSLLLFLVGAVFCFYAVFPFVLKFLLGFNSTMEIHPQIRLSEWISFAVMLPLMFGISFQLPLVMLFLERISIFDVTHYRQQRRMAVLVIAILSMLLTPADPMSMMMMMFPLMFLYELGILLCKYLPAASPFEAEPA